MKGKHYLKQLYEIFLGFDRFGQQITFQINRRKTFNTFIGSIVTFLIMMFIVYTFIIQILDMTSGKIQSSYFDQEYIENPEVNQYIQLFKNFQEVSFSKNNFTFGLTITDDKGMPIYQNESSQLFVPKLLSCYRQLTSNGSNNQCQELILRNCSTSQFKNELTEVLLFKLNRDNYKGFGYCLSDEEQNKTFNILGSSHSLQAKTFTVQVSKCQNDTVPGITCAPEQEIQNKLKGGYFIFLFNDQLIDYNGQNPFKVYRKSVYGQYSVNTFQLMVIYLKHAYAKTIKKYFYYFNEQIEIDHSLQFERIETMFDLTTQNYFLRINIQLHDQQIIYYRFYNNILNIFGNIGGLLSMLLTLGKMILPSFQNFIFFIYLTKRLVVKQKVNSSVQECLSTNKNNEKTKFKSDFHNKKQKFSFINCLKFSQDKNLNQFFQNWIQNKLDFENFLKKNIEFEILKKLLLTKEQLILFKEILNENYIFQKRYKQKQTATTDSEFGSSRYIKLKTAYQNISQKQMPSEMDLRILHCLKGETKINLQSQQQVNQENFKSQIIVVPELNSRKQEDKNLKDANDYVNE